MGKGIRRKNKAGLLRCAIMGGVKSSLVLALIFGLYGNSQAAAVSINVSSKALVAGDTISLGDIAEISGAKPELANKISSVAIARSPLPGASKSIKGDYIKVRLKQSGFDLESIGVSAPESLEVKRDFMELPEEEIKSAIGSFIQARRPGEEYEFKIKGISLQPIGPLPKGRLTYNVVFSNRNEDFAGAANIAVDLFIDERPYRRIFARANVSPLADLVVASKPLRPNQLIGEGDVSIQHREISSVAAQIMTKKEQVVGKRAKSAVGPGEMILMDMIETPPIIKRGDVVTLKAESPLISATTMGKAAENGRKGDFIKVINMSSNRQVSGRVVDSKTVMVDF